MQMLEQGTMTLGVNYWASHAATRMWSQWDAAVVEQDFVALEKIGCRLLRVFPLWPDFQPLTAHTTWAQQLCERRVSARVRLYRRTAASGDRSGPGRGG